METGKKIFYLSPDTGKESGNISTPAEYLANTNQVGGDFHRQPATFDNPAWLIFCETLNLDRPVHTPRMYSLFPTPLQVHYS